MVKAEYKQTEIGLIPIDWQTKTIGDIADVKTGPFGSALHESDYVEDGTPIITVEHLGERGVEHVNLPKVSDKDLYRLRAYSLKENDIVFSRVGSIDRNALIKKKETGWLFSGRLLRVRLRGVENHAPYLSYHFHSEPFKQRVVSVAVGQTMASLNTQILKGILVTLPTKEKEQLAIAEALADVDGLIAGLDKLIAKKRAVKTATMQQLLTGKTRLPGFGDGNGRWERVTLGELVEFFKGKGLSKSQLDDHGKYRCIHYGELFTRYGAVIEKIISHTDVNENAFYSLTNDVLMPTSDVTPNGLATASCIRENGVILGGDILVIRAPSNKLNGSFLSYCIRQERNQIMQLVSGTTVFHLYASDMKNFVFDLPQIEEQDAIVEILTDMEIEISYIETRRAKTQAIKQGMMQELLTGRTRLL